MFFCECGTGSFKHVDEGPEDISCGGSRSPRGRRKPGGKVNPYAGRGLDRFSVVLAELETRRARILRRVGSDTGLVLVRFVQSNGGWTPVVVKLPDDDEQLKHGAAAAAAKKPKAAAPPLPLPAPASPTSPLDPASPRGREEGGKKAITTKVPARRASFSWGTRVRRPSRYWPAVIVLTLVSLAVFGRVFAICLTSIWWYVLPTMGNECYDGAGGEDARRAGLRRSMEKKKLVSQPPHTKNGSSWGANEVASSPRGHAIAKGKRG
ncbi:uncharacterized protein LOC120651952 [Panicum virgatum]|uniref:ZCF37 n=1 Tax=Panicum virgatum TaxID=38727 RepID=A0A8T0NST2_PANVG|nr:uncharacterized protein LOC120651952 [Panicum virgatum]KAG2551042.1 hypothetical protein PVAP13_9KG368900 [Panicum virgatum]